jgi:S-DNA-T family DNA segregation ATPase FtsK/SpoIIIE
MGQQRSDDSKASFVSVFCGYFLAALMMPIMPLGSLALIVGGTLLLGKQIQKVLKWHTLWKNMNLFKGEMYPELREKRKTDWGVLYRFSLPPGLCFDDFNNHKQAIHDFLGKDINLVYSNKNIILEVYDEPMQHYDFEVTDTYDDAIIPVGVTRNGRTLTVDMNGEPHLLITGETGSGKSVSLRGIITNYIASPKRDVLLHLIDLKGGAELGIFRKSNKVGSFERTVAGALKSIKALSEEVERRYNLFYQEDVVNLKGYVKKTHKKLKVELLVIDEFAELMGNKDHQKLLQSLCARARACGIYVILSTQRPDANVINGLIKANITNVLCYKMMNLINSQIALDTSGAEILRGAGHGLCKSKGEIIEFQAPFLDEDDVDDFIRHTYRKTEPENKVIMLPPPTQPTINDEPGAGEL